MLEYYAQYYNKVYYTITAQFEVIHCCLFLLLYRCFVLVSTIYSVRAHIKLYSETRNSLKSGHSVTFKM